MREIKLRGFALAEMMQSQWLTGFGVMPIEMSDDYAKRTGIKKEVYLYTESGTFQVQEKSVGQYTGLKDKNGVEIYEGDCFKRVFKMIEIPTGRTFEQTEVGVVKFDDGQFTCHIDGWGHAALKDVLGYQNKNNDYWKNGLIIGNVYENPELLEKE